MGLFSLDRRLLHIPYYSSSSPKRKNNMDSFRLPPLLVRQVGNPSRSIQRQLDGAVRGERSSSEKRLQCPMLFDFKSHRSCIGEKCDKLLIPALLFCSFFVLQSFSCRFVNRYARLTLQAGFCQSEFHSMFSSLTRR